MGIKIDGKKFDIEYVVDTDKEAVVSDLKKRAKKFDAVLIATDEDREGEAIGYHITQVLDPKREYERIVFHEVTSQAIKHAIDTPRKIDMQKVNAQQARRILDRLVGYNLSPLLASKIQKGLSAGRVQSSSLKIIVDREREIQAFVPQEFWTITGVFAKDIQASLYEYGGKKLTKLAIKTGEQANAMLEDLKKQSFKVTKIEQKEKKTSTLPPFMTSTLQQAASSVLGFSPKRTMSLAQKLYEGLKTPKGVTGLITYMRTDSLSINKEANLQARQEIEKRFGKKYLLPKVAVYKSKSKAAQEAHEAIRPTNIDLSPSVLEGFLPSSELRLYALIYNRFLASQMASAVFSTQNIFIGSKSGTFKASGTRLIFDGFYAVLPNSDKDKLLPEVSTNEPLDLKDIITKQNFTPPPPRYSEASLVKTLEGLGIGRPSTYAPTISTLQDRGYIEIEKKQIRPTEVAFTVTKMLEDNFEEIVSSDFTAKMEEELDKVEDEQKNWQQLVLDFYEPFFLKIKDGKTSIKSLKTLKETDEICPACGQPLVIRKGRYGEFISCKGFPKCKYSKDLDGNEKKDEATDLVCDKCGEPMVIKVGRRGKFYACSAYPKCKNTKSLNPPKESGFICPECSSPLVERISRRGKFYGCSSYPKCKFITNYPLSDKKCPECGYAMVRKELKTKNTLECLNKECKHVIDLGKK